MVMEEAIKEKGTKSTGGYNRLKRMQTAKNANQTAKNKRVECRK
jgi:hypothetical protein